MEVEYILRSLYSMVFFLESLGTTQGVAPHMSWAYSPMVRSLENLPHWAMLLTTMVSQRLRSCTEREIYQSLFLKSCIIR